MHDELLERRLRTTLHDEADRLPFTITAAELERRVVKGGRGMGNRRLRLLLAAAVGIGLLGVGAAMGGLFDGPTPSPEPSLSAVATDLAPTNSAPVASVPAPSFPPREPGTLPSLDEMLAGIDPSTVVLAQEHGPADAPPPAVGIEAGGHLADLGTTSGSLSYQLLIACLGDLYDASLRGTSQGPGGGTFLSGFRGPCDGETHEITRRSNDPDRRWGVNLQLDGPTSWRVVVIRMDGAAPPSSDDPAGLSRYQRAEELVTVDNRLQETPLALTSPGPVSSEAGVLPTRPRYDVQYSCVGDSAARYVISTEQNGPIVATTSTYVPCDGQRYSAHFEIALPNGAQVFVVAEPGTRWSILVTADWPPIALIRNEPGWQLSTGYGPHLGFEETGHSITGLGVEGGGPVRVAFACTGTHSIEVRVDLGDNSPWFYGQCTPEGTTTNQTFEFAPDYVVVEYTAPANTWTALSILVPDQLPEP